MDTEDPSSASCRIVVVSSTLDTSREVAHRIKALSGDTSESHPSSEVINWTIKNKYYTAPVHFHPIHLEGLESIELDDVPAVIYAWKDNDPYRTHVKQVAEQTSSYNPEVSLAISMTPTTDEELEDFFFEHGFEYVEGHKEAQDKSEGLTGSSATPGLHRAVDALSTIMWPSMVRTDLRTSKVAGQSPFSVPVEGDDEVDIDYRTLVNATDNDGKSNIQREMEMLEKWLEEDDENYKEATAATDNSGYSSLESHEQPISNDPWSTTTPGVQTDAPGFDDDFTEFVSAPANSSASRPEPDVEEDSDPELPSEADIRAASTRIFRPPRSHPDRPDAFNPLPDSSRSLSHTSEAGSQGATRSTADRAELDMDAPAFDLTRILGALNTMKEEISQIPDMQERRRAAARAALGFVYGLEDSNGELDAAARLA